MAISNKVVKRYIVKRDLKEIFPKEFTGRELIGKFFDYVLNNFFEKSYERYVNGYIGRKTEVLEDGNFYLSHFFLSANISRHIRLPLTKKG